MGLFCFIWSLPPEIRYSVSERKEGHTFHISTLAHAHMHACARARAQTHRHTHTHTFCNIVKFKFYFIWTVIWNYFRILSTVYCMISRSLSSSSMSSVNNLISGRSEQTKWKHLLLFHTECVYIAGSDTGAAFVDTGIVCTHTYRHTYVLMYIYA